MENRYNELNKLLQYDIDELVNTLASHGSVGRREASATVSGASERIRELWFEAEAELDAEEAVV